MNESVRNFFALLTGLLVLAYVIWVLGWENIVVSLEQVRLDLFMLAAFFYLVNELFASSALRAATGGGVVDVCLAHMRGMLYSNVTPGRVGYYYTAFSIAKKTDKSASENVGFVTLLQGVNFSLKVFLCVAAVLYFSCILSLTDYGGLFILVVSAPFFVVVAVFSTIALHIPNYILCRNLLDYLSMNFYRLGYFLAISPIVIKNYQDYGMPLLSNSCLYFSMQWI